MEVNGAHGLSETEVKKRALEYGANALTKRRRTTALTILLEQFKNWLLLVLLLAAMISFFVGERVDALVILGIVLLSTLLGFFQEYKAEKTTQELSKFLTKKAKVIRDGVWKEINSEGLVPGDVVRIRIGDLIPADMELFEVDGLTVNEGLLTGESEPVEKDLGKGNQIYAGTLVESGLGTGVVVSTGDETKLGQTSKAINEVPEESDFQKQIGLFSKNLFFIILSMTFFIFIANALLNKGLVVSFLFALALAVGITPELLPMIVTVTLSAGALRMAKKSVVVKKLIAIEDMGNIDTLCADKTGTLTTGEFTLIEAMNVLGKSDRNVFLKALVCSSGFATRGATWSNQTDKALWKSEQKNETEKYLADYELTDENEFDYSIRRMSVVARTGKRMMLFSKGAPEAILKVCRMTDSERTKWLKKVDSWEKDGLRILFLAEKETKNKESDLKSESGLKMCGVLMFRDPLKRGVEESLAIFERLGVNVKIISGDSAHIVLAAARQTNLAKRGDIVVVGDELENLNDEELFETVKNNWLFARISPVQKKRIVASLNKEGHVVGFLGDGVNDAPALEAADVGISVDSGAEVTKDVADIVLLKKDLAVMGEGIEEGRKVFGNITKYITNTISANFGNMFTVAASSLFLPFIPLLPKQILLNNFMSDIPLLALASDNVDSQYIQKPNKWNLKEIRRFMVFFGIISSVFDFLLIIPLIFVWKLAPDGFRTAWFVESSLSEMIVTFSLRTRKPFFRSTPGTGLIILSILSILVVISLPMLRITQTLFSLVSLPVIIGVWISVELILYFGVVELVKKTFFSIKT